ncbi:MAG: SDR family oxidoreductase [Gemmatimonadetes bacterium]|nr:SDR family oxidoreductase [Gemmatimonadota bacterium]
MTEHEEGGAGESRTKRGDQLVVEPRKLERAVERLLDEVSADPQPRPLLLGEDLRGKSAIVTGGSSGIGRAIALALARNGVHIAFNYLDDGTDAARSDAEQTFRELRELEVKILCRPCDVRDSAAVRAFVDEAVQVLGGLHILVNNAGIAADSALWRMTDEEWRSVIDTNLTGAFHCIRAVAPTFRSQEHGKIVNVSSVHGVRSEFGISNYTSSKAGLVGLTRAAAIELGSSNVNVNAVAPGYIRTTRLTELVSAEILDRAREKSALKRLGDPQDVASVVLFLCSEAARHLTGALIPVDGGYLT